MQGKESDIHLALALRTAFIEKYNDVEVFDVFLVQLEKEYMEKWIHKFIKETNISITKYHGKLKERISMIRIHKKREIFIEICKINDARAWINDNGKYKQLAFNVMYLFYKEDKELLKYVNKE
ncbi:hypothetical protein [Cellulosilyticum sp. I15G10I2]|uniref:hypothetical protein n=1 Tax=Cellulosilyticum sp. I15G10I2 TaxID=1892843 RepID=UPI00085CB591|nr:hypothetical protein [Cellulosilyticum sp. I15G10I2]